MTIVQDFLPAGSAAEPLWLLGALALIGLIAGIIVTARRREWRPLCFWLIWLPAFLAPVSNLVPIAHPAALRFLYIPSAGACVALAWIVLRPAGATSKVRRIGLALLVLIFALGTIDRGRDWRDGRHLWTATLRHSPASAEVRNNLGLAYLGAGQPSKAVAQFERLVAAQPDVTMFYYNLGLAYEKLPDGKKAHEMFDIVVRREDGFMDAFQRLWYVMGRSREAAGELHQAGDAYYNVVVRDPDFADAAERLDRIRKTSGWTPPW